MTKPLTNVQSALLQTFQYQLTEEEFTQLSSLLDRMFDDDSEQQ